MKRVLVLCAMLLTIPGHCTEINYRDKAVQLQKNLENRLYEICLNRMYIYYGRAYERHVCICFVEENLKLSEKDLDKMAESDIYMAKVHENIFEQCHQKNLKYTGTDITNPHHKNENKWEY